MARKRTNAATADKKIRTILNDLEAMKAELLPDDQDPEKAFKGRDDFEQKRHAMQIVLNRVRKDVERLQELRKRLTSDGRDSTTIRLQSENSKSLYEAMDLFNQCKQQLMKDEQKKGKKRLSETELTERRNMLKLVAEELQTLTQNNSRVSDVMNDDDFKIQQRAQNRRDQERQNREQRRRSRASRKGKGGKDDIVDAKDFVSINMGPASEQEQAFQIKADQNMQDQDELLKQLSEALDELKNIAQDANRHLQIQGGMVDELEQKMDKNIATFKSANARLQEMLDQSGGMSRWCPVLICLVILLAVLGYIFHIL